MNISYDLVFEKAPCAILSVDTVDILGTHKMSLDKETTRMRLEAGTLREMGVQQKVRVV